ncbi:MAG TPA: hypothetical protein VFF04_03285 [Candidatus Babeliales bacterium]|nr:hypothetical protein [Candidatus Babeliales bacterium]
MLKFFLGLLCCAGLFAAEKKELLQEKAAEGIISFQNHQTELNRLVNLIKKKTASWAVNDVIWHSSTIKFEIGNPQAAQALMRLPHGEVEGYRSTEFDLFGATLITHHYLLSVSGEQVVIEDSIQYANDKKSFVERSFWMKLMQARKPGTYSISVRPDSKVVYWNYCKP